MHTIIIITKIRISNNSVNQNHVGHAIITVHHRQHPEHFLFVQFKH
jgi:hypothetical protein